MLEVDAVDLLAEYLDNVELASVVDAEPLPSGPVERLQAWLGM